MASVNTQYSQLRAAMTADMWWRAGSEEKLASGTKSETVEKDAGRDVCRALWLRLEPINYRIVVCIVVYRREFGVISISESSPCEPFIIYIDCGLKRILQSRRVRMM